MTEWKKYDGTDEQIVEMLTHSTGFIVDSERLYSLGKTILRMEPDELNIDWLKADLSMYGDVKAYLLCNPHPLADMICRQAQTGQPVYVRVNGNAGIHCAYGKYTWTGTHSVWVTTTPDWNIPGAEYSFSPFVFNEAPLQEEVC